MVLSIDDLYQLKHLEEQGILINRSALARTLKVDRRTVDKYINGYRKPTTRNKPSQFDCYYEIIKEVMNDKEKRIRHRSTLYTYLVETYGMVGASSSFRRYISLKPEFNEYFRVKKKEE